MDSPPGGEKEKTKPSLLQLKQLKFESGISKQVPQMNRHNFPIFVIEAVYDQDSVRFIKFSESEESIRLHLRKWLESIVGTFSDLVQPRHLRLAASEPEAGRPALEGMTEFTKEDCRAYFSHFFRELQMEVNDEDCREDRKLDYLRVVRLEHEEGLQKDIQELIDHVLRHFRECKGSL